jgi:N-formylglutamate deformylase
MSRATTTESSSDLSPEFHPGTSALLISVPHAGTALPAGMSESLSQHARELPDTDWFVDRLYGFAATLGAGLLIARTSRLVADLNRPADDQPLYDAAQTQLMTGVVPMRCFSGSPVYLPGQEPAEAEIAARLEQHWQPYHMRLQAALNQVCARHGHAVLLDAHSIRAEVPLLFDGVLPDLNLGSNGGRSAAADLLHSAAACLRSANWSVVVDGRFKGGYITRHYGQPAQRVYALQLEIAQHCYMQESPPGWEQQRANALQQHLQHLVQLLIDWKPTND